MEEIVTWRVKHFGMHQKFTSKITEFNRPQYLVDEMVKGFFKQFDHEHHFAELIAELYCPTFLIVNHPLGF